jgi:hypothetical protein
MASMEVKVEHVVVPYGGKQLWIILPIVDYFTKPLHYFTKPCKGPSFESLHSFESVGISF